jgi:uncharacterized peroxidase-related enzyme
VIGADLDLDDEAACTLADRIAADWRTAGLDPPTAALLEFTEKLTRDPAAMSAPDVAALRAAGWDDRAIHDATQICAYFNYINRVADALGVQPENWIDDVGRIC